MSATLKLATPASPLSTTGDPHIGLPEVARFGAIWRSKYTQSDVRVIAVLTDTEDRMVEHGLVSNETPSVYDGAVHLARECTRSGGKTIDYISVNKRQLPAEVKAVHLFCYSLYDGMFAPFDSLEGDFCSNVGGETFLDDNRMPWSFGSFRGCTAVFGMRLARGNIRWINSLENAPVHLALFLSRLGVTLTP